MKTLQIAVLGHGTVGKGVLDLYRKNMALLEQNAGADLIIKRVLLTPRRKAEAEFANDPLFTTSIDEILGDSEIDVVVELVGGEEPAMAWMEQAMRAGKHVVTANKMLMAKHGEALTALAKAQGVSLLYEASVAGALPILRMVEDGLAANEITEIMGILNGTTNYVLTKMDKIGLSYDEALTLAKQKGYAEADPTSDVGGFDATYKLAILAGLAFGVPVDESRIYREGIEKITDEDMHYAERLGYRIKLLAIGKRHEDGLELRVHPTLVPRSHPFAWTDGANNAVWVRGNGAGDLFLSGKGAGALPTASAVWSDLVNIARGTVYQPEKSGKTLPVKPMGESQISWYIRLTAAPQPGVMGEIADIFGVYGVFIRSMSQTASAGEGRPVEYIILTQPSREESLALACRQVEELTDVVAISTVIRVESGL